MKRLQMGSLALGSIIGFGCFILPGAFLDASGPIGSIVGIGLGALAMIVVAKSYSVMMKKHPAGGAEFAYAHIVGGQRHAFVSGWALTLGYLCIVIMNGAALLVLFKFTVPWLFGWGYLYNVRNWEVYTGELLMVMASVAAAGYLNYRGAKQTGVAQAAMTAVLVSTVVGIGVGAFTYSGSTVQNLEPAFSPHGSALESVLAMFTFAPWLYLGFEMVPKVAREFGHPTKGALRLMAVPILAGAVMYSMVLLSTAVVSPWHPNQVVEHIWFTGDTVWKSLGTAGITVLSVSVAMACLTSINGFIMASSRLLFNMGQAQVLPRWFGTVDRRRGTPRNAILFVCGVSVLAPLVVREVVFWMADIAVVAAAIGHLYTCIAAYRVVGWEGAGGGTWAPKAWAGLGIIMALTILVLVGVPGMPGFMEGPSWVILGVWGSLGMALYVVRAHR